MTIPMAHIRPVGLTINRERECHHGPCPEGSPEAAYAIWVVQQYWRSRGAQDNRTALTIKPPKPEPIAEPIPEGTRLCKRGHAQTTENARIDRRGHTVCKACDRERKTPKEDQ